MIPPIETLELFFETWGIGEMCSSRDGDRPEWTELERAGLVAYSFEPATTTPHETRLTEKGRRVLCALELLRGIEEAELVALLRAFRGVWSDDDDAQPEEQPKAAPAPAVPVRVQIVAIPPGDQPPEAPWHPPSSDDDEGEEP